MLPVTHFFHARILNHRLRRTICVLLTVVAISRCQSQFRPPQVAITDNDTVGFPFLQLDSNFIRNNDALKSFYKKLFIQRVSGGERINVVHIGDSHILGNFLTEPLRYRLQDAFGDAGRGVIFPYKLAGSNGPRDYLVETNVKWKGSNCQLELEHATDFGLSGFCLETLQDRGWLAVRSRDTANVRLSPFTKVTIFYRKTPQSFDFEISDDITHQKAQKLSEDEYSTSFVFDRPVAQFSINHLRTGSGQRSLTIDGICIENELSGIVYHSIGVNGGKFLDFARAKYFAKEIGRLRPDLIIVSLGTNEAQGAVGPKGLYSQMKGLMGQLKEFSPETPILLTTPADSYLRGKGYNPYMPQISSIIRRYAHDNGMALWDLFAISGGEKSAKKWRSNGLMTSDSVHYNKTGYLVQGKLFYLSLIGGYNQFVETLAQEARVK